MRASSMAFVCARRNGCATSIPTWRSWKRASRRRKAVACGWSRPYLFSNSLPPVIANAALKAVELIAGSADLRDRLHSNARQLRQALEGAGFKIKPGQHPILPVMLGDATLAGQMADRLLQHGI